MTDTVSDTIRSTSLGKLLKVGVKILWVISFHQDPNIINNQGSNLTKTLYALKGVAQDFKDLRLKSGEVERGWLGGCWSSGYTEEEVGYNLSLVYGPDFSGSLVHQVRNIFASCKSILMILYFEV